MVRIIRQACGGTLRRLDDATVRPLLALVLVLGLLTAGYAAAAASLLAGVSPRARASSQ